MNIQARLKRDVTRMSGFRTSKLLANEDLSTPAIFITIVKPKEHNIPITIPDAMPVMTSPCFSLYRESEFKDLNSRIKNRLAISFIDGSLA